MRRILYVQYTNPAAYPPLQHSSRILAEAGWQVLFLGTGAQGASGLNFPPHPNVTVRKMPFCPAGWRQKLHYMRFALWVVVRAVCWRPHWVYASDLLSCPIGLVLGILPGTRVIYHEHDSPTVLQAAFGEGPRGPSTDSRFQRFLLGARRALARRASECVLPNIERIKQFSEITQRAGPVRCVWNCPSRGEAAFPIPPREGRELWVWYHGSIVPPQLPDTVVKALALLPASVKLRIAGYETVGHRGYVRSLQALAKELGIPERLVYLGTLPTRAQLLEEAARCHVGISLFPADSRQPMTGASNKPFDYLACGLALLVSDLPDWRTLYVAPGYGLASDPESPDSIAAALRWFLDHPEETRAMGEAGRRRILQEWNYETQFEPVLSLLRGDRERAVLAPAGTNGKLSLGNRPVQARDRS